MQSLHDMEHENVYAVDDRTTDTIKRDEKRKSKNNSRTVRRQMRQEMNMYQLDC